jgi:hypothetical protein
VDTISHINQVALPACEGYSSSSSLSFSGCLHVEKLSLPLPLSRTRGPQEKTVLDNSVVKPASKNAKSGGKNGKKPVRRRGKKPVRRRAKKPVRRRVLSRTRRPQNPNPPNALRDIHPAFP